MTIRRLFFLLYVLAAQVAVADRLVTLKGTEVNGRLELNVLVIQGEEAQLELPRSSIIEIRPNGELVVVRLVDGSEVQGAPLSADIAIRSDLYSQRFVWADIRLVELDLDASGPSASSAFVRVDDVQPTDGKVERPSPLRLEIDIDAVRDLKAERGAAWTSSRMRLFYCDGVSIPVLRIEKRVDKGGYVTLTLEVSVRVQLSFDRMIDLEVQLLAHPDHLRKYRDSFEVEEGHIRRVEFLMRFSQEEFERVFSSSAQPRLRFSLTPEEA